METVIFVEKPTSLYYAPLCDFFDKTHNIYIYRVIFLTGHLKKIRVWEKVRVWNWSPHKIVRVSEFKY